jgi:hypothetical protein
MLDRVPCEFFLVRYVPDVVKGEFVNIGVLLREAAEGTGANSPMRIRFTRDWSRVRCMDAENLTTELEQLMRLYVEPMAQASQPRPNRKTTGRPALQAAMRDHFERAGAWQLMNKRIPAERYTRKGDPLKLDCGYRKDLQFGKALRVFQAVSLEGDLESAKVLAYMSPHLHAGVNRMEDAALELTAVVEPLAAIAAEEGESRERYRFGVETMEQQRIRVITINDLARAAATARHELNR